ncbi:MAG: hypothetical protein V4640_02460 [Verrucomicrobiota bacterium]
MVALFGFLGFGLFLNSRFEQLAKVEQSNRLLEQRIAEKWAKTAAKHKAAALATEVRKNRFELRRLAALFISARVAKREVGTTELAVDAAKLSSMPADEFGAVVDELHAASFPKDTRMAVEAMLVRALADQCAAGSGKDALIHQVLMKTLAPPDPELTRSLIGQMEDTSLRREVIQRLELPAPP